MQSEKIYLERIKKFAEEIQREHYIHISNLEAEYIYDPHDPIPYEESQIREFKPISIGEKWGDLWGCAWFKFRGVLPNEFSGKKIGALINVNGEACVFKNGEPWQGLTNKIHWNLDSGKTYVPLFERSKGNEKVELLVEAGANGLFGNGQNDYSLKQAELVWVNDDIFKLFMDIKVLFNLAENQPQDSPRRNKVIYGLNEVTNSWNGGKGLESCLKITENLLEKKANSSSLNAYSIGHAHLDLAWLWPIRETRRKGGRTFATALKLLGEYQDYKFGASQPQLYAWIKEDYPELYKKVKKAVAEKRWECQGAMWVEPDMNLTGGESLIRQCLYGKKFFQAEFGQDVNNLWLPDVFGYSAALPQILKKCKIDFFMTQKISWNETNEFPLHTFMWQGIDGTEILSHFLPTNDYNLANLPEQLIKSEKRYSQNDISDEFLNLYGIGDGGGGPSRMHIEMGLRQQNLEGVPKFKFSFAEDFFEKIAKIPKEKLPTWVGELYLELHRGTYTTQGWMKKFNRNLEMKLRDLEFLFTLTDDYPQKKLEKIWKETLLNQFHDILPGSSITWVYEDAHKLSEKNLEKLEVLEKKFFTKQFGRKETVNDKFLAFNTLSWERNEIVNIPAEDGQYWVGDGSSSVPVKAKNGFLEFEISVPAMGYKNIVLEKLDKNFPDQAAKIFDADEHTLENELVKVKFDAAGAIISIFDKEIDREILAGSANKLMLWEDKPNNWGAWDINHFYQETKPEIARRKKAKITHCSNLQVELTQELEIGNSTILQKISLHRNSKLVKIRNHVDWKEEHKMLRVRAQPDVYTDTASFEIQYGNLKRPTHRNTSWERAKFEVAAHRFVDLSQSNYGFAILNDCKYGHSVLKNKMELALLRSPKDTDPKADEHEHDFTFAYYPHQNKFEESDVFRQAHQLNSPLIVHPVERSAAEPWESYYQITGKNVKIESVKKAENGNGIVLRVYETLGKHSTHNLFTPIKYDSIYETNMLEEIEKELVWDKTNPDLNGVELKLHPFEIRTFLLE